MTLPHQSTPRPTQGTHAANRDYVDEQLSVAATRTFLDIDFTVQDNQTFSADGDVTIGGQTFYIDNQANTTVFDILNGTGLRIRNSTTSTDHNSSTRSGPLVGVRLTDISADLNLAKLPYIRVWFAWTGTSDPDANFERFNFGFESKQVGGFSAGTYSNWFGLKSHTLQFGSLVTGNGASTNAVNFGTDDFTDDVMMVKLQGRTIEVWTGAKTASGDFPEESAMKLRGYGSQTGDNPDVRVLVDELAAFCSISTANGSGNLEIALERMRIDAPGIAVREPGITELLNIDFTLEPTQDLTASGDGDYTIAGKTFYVDNTANADGIDITNGTGLVIDHTESGGSDLFNTTRTCPIVGIRWKDLDVDQGDVQFARAWCIFSDGFDTNVEFQRLGVEYKQSSFVGGEYHNWWIGKQFDTSLLKWNAGRTFNGATGSAPNQTNVTSDDVMMVKYSSDGTLECWTGASVGGDFPSIKNMRRRYTLTTPDLGSVQVLNGAADGLAFFMATAATVASANHTVTVTKFKVDVPSNVVKEPTNVGGWEKLQTVHVVGSATDTITFDGLNGDEEDVYKIEYSWIHGSTTNRDISVRPNGLTTNQASNSHNGFGQASNSYLMVGGSTRANTYGEFTIQARRNAFGSSVLRGRGVLGQSVGYDDPPVAGSGVVENHGGIWTGTESITSLDLVCSVDNSLTKAADFAVGTVATLYRRRRA